MSGSAWLRAPAKVNLGLRIVGRRPDGYHLLESCFLPLDLADRLRIEVEPAAAAVVALSLRGHREPGVPDGPENLAARAARDFLEVAGRTARISIALEKRIPAGAGLGGGSSDAAAVLRALSHYFANVVAKDTLAELAVRLGADVPFFLDPRPARVHGIGDAIEPLAAFPSLALLLVTPAPPLATAAVFRAWDLALTPSEAGRSMRTPGGDTRPISFPPSSPPVRESVDAAIDALAVGARNDLEPVAERMHPGIGRVRSELGRLGARGVAMSGSGPTMFGIFDAAESARIAARQGRWEGTDRVFVARTQGAP